MNRIEFAAWMMCLLSAIHSVASSQSLLHLTLQIVTGVFALVFFAMAFWGKK